jgi:poly(A) polymerase
MMDGGLLLPILGGVTYVGAFAALISIERALGLAPDPIRRLGALAVAVTEDAKRLATRLRLSNAEAKALDSMGHRWWRLAGMDEATAQRRLYRLGEDRYRDRLILAWARSGEGSEAASWRELATLPERWKAPKFPLKAADFIARGIVQGPELGQALALAEDAWLAASFPLDEPSLDAIAGQAVTRLNRERRP